MPKIVSDLRVHLRTVFFIEHFRWLLLNGKWKKLKRANLESSVNVQKQPPKILYKKSFSLTRWNGVAYNCVSYLFVSFWYYHVYILSKSNRTEVFYKKVFLKISQNSQENTCTGVSFFWEPLVTLMMKRFRHSVFQSRWLFLQKAPS